MSGLNYERARARDKARVGSSPISTLETKQFQNRPKPPSKKQLDYIRLLAKRGRAPVPRVWTRSDAGEAIKWLKALPENQRAPRKAKRPRKRRRARAANDWLTAEERRMVEQSRAKMAP